MTVEMAMAAALKHVTDEIDDEEALNRAPDALAHLRAAGYAVVEQARLAELEDIEAAAEDASEEARFYDR